MAEALEGTTYAALRAGGLPNSFVVDAVDGLGGQRGHALDIGAGPLNETRFLLRRGFDVDAIDTDPLVGEMAASLGRGLTFMQADIRDVRLAREKYLVAVAIHVLPFLPRAALPGVIAELSASLLPGGLLCFTLFGVKDGWAGLRPQMTFFSREEVIPLFAGLRPVLFEEEEHQGTNARNEPKHWHVFRGVFKAG